MDIQSAAPTFYQDTLAATQQINDQLNTLNAQAATGQKFAKVSDDPTDAMAVIADTDVNGQLTAQLGNIKTATAALNNGVSALQQVNNIISQAQALAEQASSSVNDPTSFSAMANQVNQLINNLVTVANSQNNGTYLFSGSASNTQPYVATQDAAGNVQSVAYQGGTAGTSTVVTGSQQAEIYYPGNQVFQAQVRQTPLFSGSTGAAPGTGIDSATGQATLTISHTATTFAAGSGVQPGTNSASGDTILGAAGTHNLQITDTSGNGSAGTISLDGGPAVRFTNTDSNLEVTNNAGQAVYLDTTAITPGYDGTVAITSTGSMSIDGTTSTPITFANNQSITDSKTGDVTFVDTTSVQGTGTVGITYPGTDDAFQALITLRNDINNVNGLSSTDQIAAISNQINDLKNVNNQVLQSIGQQSATLQSLSSLQSQLQNLQLSTQENISNVGDADVTKVVVQLQTYEQMLQLSLEAFAQIHSVSLLNYLH